MFVEKQVAFDRLSICNNCPRLIKATWTCKECGCFMKVKARMDWAECPIGKWHSEKNSE